MIRRSNLLTPLLFEGKSKAYWMSRVGGTQVFTKQRSPKYVAQRLKYFDEIWRENQKQMSKVDKPPITVTLKDGKTIQGRAFQTTPLSLLKLMPRQVGQQALVAKLQYTTKYQSPFNQGIISTEPQEHSSYQDYEIVDLSRPLEGNCTLELVNFTDKAGKDVFWHSSAHLLGQGIQTVFGAWLCHGPSTQHGFFYDSFMGDYSVSQSDYDKLEAQIKKYSKEKQKFERALITKSQALELFSSNPFKIELIKGKIPDGSLTTVYRCGSLIDLCRGPHIPSSEKVKGFKIIKNSAAYWNGQKQNNQLQRVYGVSYPKQSQLEDYLKLQEQLLKKDHRFIGTAQQLFNFSTLTPGSPFFLHHGATIYNRLIELMRSQYKIRGYQEVITPNIFHSQLWKMSGHYFKYKQHIYTLKEGHSHQQNGLKPMNCPGHCVAFSFTQKSYKDLPVRMADFGVLHRNQLHGALSGLTRVRRFQQDDAHIFCTSDQIMDQILGVLDLLHYVYSVFGFKYSLQLSTRPEKFLGHINDWEKAQRQLRQALDKNGAEYKINEGDGAFYGPKIDVKLTDVFQRQHQCGTIQLDFQLPVRFDLQYRTKDSSLKEQNPPEQQKGQDELSEQQKYARVKPLKQGFARPIIIHRAIFGSLQRFIAILCEQTGGKWDFWISPRQLKLVTVNQDCQEYAEKVFNTLLLKGYSVQLDQKSDNLNKKIRRAQLDNFNFIGVIGKEEVEKGTISLRQRDEGKDLGSFSIGQLLSHLEVLRPPKSKRRLNLQSRSL